MPSSPKITKREILQAALELLLENGYGSVQIKAIASKLNCSTQPVSWQFQNMANFRKEFSEYALEYAERKMAPKSDSGFEAFTEVGAGYAGIAFDEPELFRYLYMNGGEEYCIGGTDSVASVAENRALVEAIAADFELKPENAAEYLTNTVIYTHGILSLVVSGVMKCGRAEAMKRIDSAGYAFLAQAGGNVEKAKNYGNRLVEKN